jgi:hypothetical protein
VGSGSLFVFYLWDCVLDYNNKYLVRMSSMEQMKEDVDIEKYAKVYGRFSSLINKASSLYIVVGAQ